MKRLQQKGGSDFQSIVNDANRIYEWLQREGDNVAAATMSLLLGHVGRLRAREIPDDGLCEAVFDAQQTLQSANTFLHGKITDESVVAVSAGTLSRLVAAVKSRVEFK